MAALVLDKVEVYLYRRRAGRVEFLVLRRAPGRRLAGVWQPITGKLEKGESVFAAAARELLEETGIRAERWWMLESPTIYLDGDGRLVVLPMLVAEASPRARVKLSREHDRARFASATAAARLFLWDSQRLGLEAVRRQVLCGGSRARAHEVRPGAKRRGPRRSLRGPRARR